MARILYVVNSLPFLLTHRLPLVAAARAAGHEVHVAFGGGAPADAAVAALTNNNIPHTRLPFRRAGRDPVEYLRAPAVLERVYADFRPDLVHAISLKSLLYAARAGRRIARRRGKNPKDIPALVGAVTGLGYLFTDGGWKKRLLRRFVLGRLRAALAAARPRMRLIVQNDDDAALLTAAGVAGTAELRLIPGAGVDTAAFLPPPPDGPEWEPGPPAPGLAPTDDRVVIALPARLLRDKGVGEFVAAARIAGEEGWGARARFILAGDLDAENPAAVAEAEVRAWTAAGLVEWSGWVADMPAFWRRAAVACLPSYREGLPKALLEAMAAGRPCVATDVPGCRSAVIDGENGRLVAARDAAALAAALREAADSPESRRRWGRAGRRLAEERFALHQIHAATFAVYDELR